MADEAGKPSGIAMAILDKMGPNPEEMNPEEENMDDEGITVAGGEVMSALKGDDRVGFTQSLKNLIELVVSQKSEL